MSVETTVEFFYFKDYNDIFEETFWWWLIENRTDGGYIPIYDFSIDFPDQLNHLDFLDLKTNILTFTIDNVLIAKDNNNNKNIQLIEYFYYLLNNKIDIHIWDSIEIEITNDVNSHISTIQFEKIYIDEFILEEDKILLNLKFMY